jgi:PAS domain S-box-containing protein
MLGLRKDMELERHKVPASMRLTQPKGYAFATGVVLVVALVKVFALPIIGNEANFFLFSGAVILSAWLGGFGPGVWATVFSIPIVELFFLGPGESFFTHPERELTLCSLFFLQGLITAFIIDRMHETSMLRALSDSHYSQLVESAKDYAIFSLNSQGEVTSWNSGAQSMFGYRDSEIIGKNAIMLFTPEDQAKGEYQKELTTAATQGRADDNRYHLRKNGERFFVNGILTAIYDEKKKIKGFTKILRDVTERKRAEDQIRHQFELLDLSKDAVVVKDRNGIIQFWNRGAEEIYGWSKEHALGKNIDSLLKTRYPIPQEEVDQILLDDQRWEGELIQTKSDGTTLFIEARWAIRRQNGTPTAVLEINRDVSARKDAETALRSSRERLELSQEATGIGTFEWDLERDIVTRSKGFETIYGRSTGDLGTTFEEWIKFVHKDDLPSVRSEIAHSLSSGAFFKDFRVIWPNRSIHWLHARARVFFDNQGKPIRMIGVNVDVTERKKMEEELKSSRDNLERVVFRRTSDLTKSNEELVRSNRELEAFAYIASHDLQEPLRMVSTYLQLLQKKQEHSLDHEATQYIQYARDGALRMKNLIDDLLSYSRVRNQPLELKLTSFETILAEALSNLRLSIQESHARITHDPLPSIPVDPSQMVELIQNLIGNAIKFRKEPPHIHVNARYQNEEWIFSVRDNGIGIAPEYHQRIFNFFQRLHTSDRYPGTGMGLAICKLIVERHDGRIWVESNVGKGATFSFALPSQTPRQNVDIEEKETSMTES